MPVRSFPRPVSFRWTALAVAAMAVLAACSKQADSTPPAPVAASDAAAPMAMQPAAVATQAPMQAPAPRVVDRSSYVNESTAPDAPVQADDDDSQRVTTVYIDPPLEQPAPVAVDWAPPPMRVEEISPQPAPDAIWTGGYWAWQGRWVWSAGRWSRPPRPDYRWHEPYYEHRADKVVYVPAYWSPPERHFVAPAVGIAIAAAVIAVGVHAGHHAEGPQGVFIPPPPGSRPGLIVPAPIGTPPSVVLGAPPVVKVGMRVNGNVENNSHDVTNNVDNITNVRNVTVIAPATATANGRGFQQAVAADPHRPPAAAPGARPTAPPAPSQTPVAAVQPGRPAPGLPAPQPARGSPPPHGDVPEAPGARPPLNDDPRPAPRPHGLEPAPLQQAQQQQARVQQDQARQAQQQADRQKTQQAQQQRAPQEQAQRVQPQEPAQKAPQEPAPRPQRSELQRAQPDNQRAQPDQQQRAQQEQQRAQQDQAAKANAAREQADKARADPQRRAPPDTDRK